MPPTQGSTTRDALFLALMYAALALCVTGLAVAGVMHRAARPTDDLTQVLVACVGATPWLISAAVAAWQARLGNLTPWLPIALGLLVLWLAACGLVVRSGSTGVAWYVVPLMCLGVVAAIPLLMVGQVAHRAAAQSEGSDIMHQRRV